MLHPFPGKDPLGLSHRLAVLLLIKFLQQLQGRAPPDLLLPVQRGSGPGAGVVVVHLHQIGVEQAELVRRVGDVLLVGEGDVDVGAGVSGVLVIFPEGQLRVCAPQLHHVPQGDQGQGAQGDAALLPQLNHGDGFVPAGLGEGVFEGRAAVAHRLPAHVLGVVEVSQGHVVKGVEDRHVHVVRAAHRELLRVAGEGPRDELVGHQHVALGRVHLHSADGRGEGVRVGGDLLVGEHAAHVGGLQKGEQVDADRAELVGQGEGDRFAAVDRGDVDAAALHQPSAEGHALRGVVVSADEEDLEPPFRQTHQKIVQKRHRLRGGDGFVIHVPRDQDPVRLFPVDPVQDAVQNVLLVLQHGEITDPLAQMQVGEMDQFHSRTPPVCTHYTVPLPPMQEAFPQGFGGSSLTVREIYGMVTWRGPASGHARGTRRSGGGIPEVAGKTCLANQWFPPCNPLAVEKILFNNKIGGMMDMELKERLSALRNERGLSQNDLAQTMNVSRQAISRWEVGSVFPSLDNLIWLSRFYHVSLDELVGNVKKKEPPPQAEENPEPVKPEPAKPNPAFSRKTVWIAFAIMAAVMVTVNVAVWVYFFSRPSQNLNVPISIEEMDSKDISGMEQEEGKLGKLGEEF